MRCYLLAVCSSSSLERDTNNMSLFHLTEEVQAPPFDGGQNVALQVHAYFEAEENEVGRTFEMRALWLAADGAVTYSPNPNAPVTMEARRMRVRTQNLAMPPAFGAYKLQLEWRRDATDTWTREPAAWPFTVTRVATIPPASLI
jgi:hypothetical protein